MTPRPAPPRQAVHRWGSRLGAVAVAVAGLLLGLPARPALAAAGPPITVTVTQRWQLAGTQGTWTPYEVTVRDNSQAGFTGDVYLLPNDTRSVAPYTYPTYHAPITVAHGGQRTVVFDVIDSPGGYTADVRDASGRLVAHGDSQTTPNASSALGVLSDLTQAEQKIEAPLRALTRVDSALTRFSSAQDFPTNAVYLSGLSGIVVDQFDSAALSQAQVQALEDYVGLGGTLIEAGGPTWRRTLLSLPAQLLPMRPTSTTEASLSALTDLAGRSTQATAQVASGLVGSGGKVTLAADDGQALVVEGVYGAGRVVELTFDPFAEPFDTQVDLAGMAWSIAISRALSGVQGGSRSVVSSGFGSATTSSAGLSAAPGSWAPGFTNSSDQIFTILSDEPSLAPPPVGLLGGLLVAYVLLAGLLNYLFLKAAGRRPLMWVTVPLIAIVFTAGAYGVGFGSRGSDFLVTEVQVQRLAPGGAVESYSFEGVYPPRKGDVTLSLPGSTLVSTAVAVGAFGDNRGDALITEGAHPQVLLSNMAVWTPRLVQTLTVTHPSGGTQAQPAMPVDAQLQVRKGHVVGKVSNLGQRPISDLELVSASSSEAVLAAKLAPGATASVDVELSPGPSAPIASSQVPAADIPGVSESSRESMIRLASSQAVNGVPGALALVGFTQATDSITVDGARPGRSVVAAVVEPVTMQSADALSGIAPRPRLVSNYGSADGSTQVDVYDFDLPGGLTTQTVLSYQMPDMSQPNVRSVEVYDWTARTWRSLPKQPVTARSQGPVALRPGEVSQGEVRVRVVEGYATNGANLAVGDQPSG